MASMRLAARASPPTARAAARSPRRAPRRAAPRAASVLLHNTPAGGHAVIGFHLARQLASQGHAVTIMVPCEEGADKMRKLPFSRFGELRAAGVETVFGKPAEGFGRQFDVVIDNNGKDVDSVKPVAEWAASQGAKQFLYVSSAGIYKPSVTPPHVEGDAVKSSASHVAVEEYLQAGPMAESIFRPQYITGEANNKDCEEWFFDRIVRGRPVPVPGDGMAVTNVAQVEDMAKMIGLAVGNPNAHGQIFNCVGDRGVTLNGLVQLCAEAAGVSDVKIVNYDPEAIGVEGKKAFPFRYTYHFFSEPRNAVARLGMTYERPLAEALKARFADYQASGRASADLSAKFELDDKILAAMGASTVSASSW